MSAIFIILRDISLVMSCLDALWDQGILLSKKEKRKEKDLHIVSAVMLYLYDQGRMSIQSLLMHIESAWVLN